VQKTVESCRPHSKLTAKLSRVSAIRDGRTIDSLNDLTFGGIACSSDDTKNVGSFMVVEADSLAAVQRFHDNDPFTVAGLFEDVRIHRWDKHVG